MTFEELKRKIAHQDCVCMLNKTSIYREFAEQNGCFKMGESVPLGDKKARIRIADISAEERNGDLEIYYSGPIIRMDGKPSKGDRYGAVLEAYQHRFFAYVKTSKLNRGSAQYTVFDCIVRGSHAERQYCVTAPAALFAARMALDNFIQDWRNI